MNKKERHLVYVEALKEYKDQQIGLCSAIQEAMFTLTRTEKLTRICITKNEFDVYNSFYRRKTRTFPEIVKHKPEDEEYRSIWFSKDAKGVIKHIAILEQAIKETE